MKILDVNNKFLTNKRSKQAAHHRINTFVTVLIVSMHGVAYGQLIFFKVFVEVTC